MMVNGLYAPKDRLVIVFGGQQHRMFLKPTHIVPSNTSFGVSKTPPGSLKPNTSPLFPVGLLH